MYTELIKRSRLYLECRKHYENKRNAANDQQSSDNQDEEIINEVMRQPCSSSLLLTKRQLQQMIMLLHVENTVLRGYKNPNQSENFNQKMKRQQKQQERAAHLDQLKYKLQMHSNQLKQSNKKVENFRFKIEVCEEYLKQTQTYRNARSNIETLDEQKKDLSPMPDSRKRTEKKLNQQIPTSHEVPIIELIKGFENLNKLNDSLLDSFNCKDSPLQKKGTNPQAIKSLTKADDSSLKNKHIEKDSDDDSSSLIETSSFLANYQQPNSMPKFSGSIKEILNESQVSVQMAKEEAFKDENPAIQSEEEGQKSQTKKSISVEEQGNLKNESSDQSIEEQQNNSDDQEGLSFGMIKYTNEQENHHKNQNHERFNQIANNCPLQGRNQQIKVNFLSVLSKFNSNGQKLKS